MTSLNQAAAVAANPPSFVDLRQFARDQSQGIPAAALEGDDRFLSSRRVLDWASDSPVTAGAIALALMLAVLGLATTYRTRSDVEHQWRGARAGVDGRRARVRGPAVQYGDGGRNGASLAKSASPTPRPEQ